MTHWTALAVRMCALFFTEESLDLLDVAAMPAQYQHHEVSMTSYPQSLFKPTDAAAFLGLSPGWLAKLRLTGAGPAYLKLGRQIRYRPADLLTWAEQGLRHSTSEEPIIRVRFGSPGDPK